MIYVTQRTVIDLRDQENGNYYDANALLEGFSEVQTIRIREGLELAQRSKMYKYVCAICGHPLKLCNRVTNHKESWFFTHFANSEDWYTKLKGLEKDKLKQMVIQFLQNFGSEGARREFIFKYLKDVLPFNKTEEQQLRIVGRLLVEMNEERLIGKE